MSILFASSEDIDFMPMNGAPVTTTAGTFDPAYARGGLASIGKANDAGKAYWKVPIGQQVADLWFKTLWKYDATNTMDYNFITLRHSSQGVFEGVARIYGAGSAGAYGMRPQIWNGAAWANVGTVFHLPRNTLYALALRWKRSDAGGEFSVWGGVNGNADTLLSTFSGDTNLSGVSDVDEVALYSGVDTTNHVSIFSEVIVATHDIRSSRVKTLAPAGAGAYAAMVGDYTAVDEVILSTADVLIADTAGQIESMTLTGLPATPLEPECVFVSARATCGASGPQHLQVGVRSAAVDGFSPDAALDAGGVTVRETWTTDPATAAAWTKAAFAAPLEAAVKATA